MHVFRQPAWIYLRRHRRRKARPRPPNALIYAAPQTGRVVYPYILTPHPTLWHECRSFAPLIGKAGLQDLITGHLWETGNHQGGVQEWVGDPVFGEVIEQDNSNGQYIRDPKFMDMGRNSSYSVWCWFEPGQTAHDFLIAGDTPGSRYVFAPNEGSNQLRTRPSSVVTLAWTDWPKGEWVHFGLTWTANGASNVDTVFYWNGERVGTSTNDAFASSEGHSYSLGGIGNTTTGGFTHDGRLALYGRWTRVLSDGEMQALYKMGLNTLTQPRPKIIIPPASLPDPGGQDVPISVALESDSAFPITWSKSMSIGTAAETDTGFSVTPERGYDVGLADETDSAFAVGSAKAEAIGRADEIDTAFAMTIDRGYSVGQAEETDSAFSVAWSKAMDIGLATESDTAFPVGSGSATLIGTAEESSSSFAVVISRALSIGTAGETDSAFAMTWAKDLAIGVAVSGETAFPIGIATGDDSGALGYTLQFGRLHYTLPASDNDYTLEFEHLGYTLK